MSTALRPIPAAADVPAVESFAYQLFRFAADEVAREPRRLARLTAAAIAPDRLSSTASERPGSLSIPLPFQLWLSHLLWLEEVVNTLECRPADLTAVELAGLQAVARARARFLRQHRICPHCDAVNPRLAADKRCRRCHEEL